MPCKSLYILCLFAVLAVCCYDGYTDGSGVVLRFSRRELNFDTILAPIGSATAHFAVHNRSAQNIVIRHIQLNRGNASPFLININGQSAFAENIRIAKLDSILIFVEVKSDMLLGISDSVVFLVGGAAQYFPLHAFVQNAITYDDTTFYNYIRFSSAMPHLFFGNAIIAENTQALIDSGSQMLFARGKGLIVNGTLKVNGSRAKPILFAGARHRESWYADKNGQWQGISIGSVSAGSSIEYAIINNADIALSVVDSIGGNDAVQLTLRRCSVAYANSHLCVKGGRVNVDSSLFSEKRMHENIALPADSVQCW